MIARSTPCELRLERVSGKDRHVAVAKRTHLRLANRTGVAIDHLAVDVRGDGVLGDGLVRAKALHRVNEKRVVLVGRFGVSRCGVDVLDTDEPQTQRRRWEAEEKALSSPDLKPAPKTFTACLHQKAYLRVAAALRATRRS